MLGPFALKHPYIPVTIEMSAQDIDPQQPIMH